VLVTGGAGYVGSHVAKALARAGYRPVVFDNLSAGHRAAVADGVLVEGDVLDTDAVRAALRTYRVEAVVHCAAWLSVADSVRDPVGYYRTNVGGALSVLAAMVAEGVGCFVLSSTAAVYGDPLVTPIAEDHPTRPVSPYGETKLAVERALPHYERAYGLRAMSLRYFNAAGADPEGELGEDHRPESHLIPRAIDAALGGPPLAVFGTDYPTPDGTCVRDYVHVADLADAHVLALEALRAGAASGVYNLGSGRPASVRQVIAAVERVTGRAVPWVAAPRRVGDPAVLAAASQRARRELGWRPRYEALEPIVETAWRWRQAHPCGYPSGASRGAGWRPEGTPG
jgi:UDP-glucose-4-epimerase GalE